MIFDTVIFDDELTALSKPKAGTGFAKYIKPREWRRQAFWLKFMNDELIDACSYAARAKHEETCAGCQYWHGRDRIVCAVHPEGWGGNDCPSRLL